MHGIAYMHDIARIFIPHLYKQLMEIHTRVLKDILEDNIIYYYARKLTVYRHE